MRVSDRRLDTDLQHFRHDLRDLLAQLRQAEDQENHAGEGDHRERALPGHAHLLDDDIGEDDVRAHRGRNRQRQIGPQPHHHRAEDRGQRRGADKIGTIHSGIGHDRGIHGDDIGHCRERGRSGHHLAANARATLGEAKGPIEQPSRCARRWLCGSSLRLRHHVHPRSPPTRPPGALRPSAH